MAEDLDTIERRTASQCGRVTDKRTLTHLEPIGAFNAVLEVRSVRIGGVYSVESGGQLGAEVPKLRHVDLIVVRADDALDLFP